MPKAILEFDLPEEQSEFENALNGVNYRILLGDLYTWLRAKWKYGNDETEAEWASKVWEKVCQLNDDDLEIP